MRPIPATDQVLHEDTLLAFTQFGLDRQLKDWQPMDYSRPILDLGPGTKRVVLDKMSDGYRTVLPKVWQLEWPQYDFDQPGSLDEFEDDSVGGIVAVNVLEHLHDPRIVLTECARVLAPGAPMNICVPHAQSISYFQDLDHKTPFVLDTWDNWLYSPYYEKGRPRPALRVGVNILWGFKEDNLAIYTQLIKEEK